LAELSLGLYTLLYIATPIGNKRQKFAKMGVDAGRTSLIKLYQL